MKTLALLLLLGAVCRGKLGDSLSLTDLLKRYISRMESVDNQMTSSDDPVWPSNNPMTPSDSPMTPSNNPMTPSDSPMMPSDNPMSTNDNPMSTNDNPVTPDWESPASSTMQPSQSWMEEEFGGLEEAFLFPGSWYLIRLIEQYIENSMYEPLEVEDIKDFFEVPECDMEDLQKVFKVYKAMDLDPESVALLATRMFVRPVLMERMKCPAAIFDTTIIKIIMHVKGEFMRTEDESLYTFFREMAPLVDPAFKPYADEIAESGVHEFHGTIFNQSIEYLIGLAFKDWAFSTHRLFSELVDYFRYFNPPEETYSEMELKYRVQNALWEVRCPDSYELIENHKKIVWRMKEVFGIIETEHVCLGVVDFLHEFVSRTMPEHVPEFENNSHLNVVCETLKDVIDDIVRGYSEYENQLFSMNIQDFEEHLSVLRPDEWTLFEEAYRRLELGEIPH